MASRTVFHIIETTKSLQEVSDACKKSLMLLGGQLIPQGNTIIVKQGINGVNFAFAANFEAYINIRQSDSSKYEFTGTINWSPNSTFWACLIIGFFVLGILWIIPLLYLFIDPTQAYQQAFFRIQSFLN